MEVIQQDQEAIAQPGADGEPHLAYDGNELAKAQAGRSCSIIEAAKSPSYFECS
jgi:hypothetical protein